MSRGRTGTRKLREALLGAGKTASALWLSPVWALLVRQGWEVDVKRVHRLYKAEGLMVRRLKRKRISATGTVKPAAGAAESGMGNGLCVGCTGNRPCAANLHPD